MGSVNALAVSEDDALLASAGTDKIINIWDLHTHARVQSIKLDTVPGALYFYRELLIVAANDARVRAFNVSRGDVAHVYEMHTGVVWALTVRTGLETFERILHMHLDHSLDHLHANSGAESAASKRLFLLLLLLGVL